MRRSYPYCHETSAHPLYHTTCTAPEPDDELRGTRGDVFQYMNLRVLFSRRTRTDLLCEDGECRDRAHYNSGGIYETADSYKQYSFSKNEKKER